MKTCHLEVLSSITVNVALHIAVCMKQYSLTTLLSCKWARHFPPCVTARNIGAVFTRAVHFDRIPSQLIPGRPFVLLPCLLRVVPLVEALRCSWWPSGLRCGSAAPRWRDCGFEFRGGHCTVKTKEKVRKSYKQRTSEGLQGEEIPDVVFEIFFIELIFPAAS